MSTIASYYEVSEARLFLRLIGASAYNNQLLLAVVALIRASGRGFDVRAAAHSLVAGAGIKLVRASAASVENKAMLQLALNAARGGNASDFLYALALSNFSGDHFGGYASGQINAAKNRLFSIYSKFTGLNLSAPQAPPKPPKMPPVPHYLAAPAMRVPGAAFAVQSFYNSRHTSRNANVVSGSTLDTAGSER